MLTPPTRWLSIVVCTRNRAASLTRTLESLGALAVPDGCTAELVVVDNGSTDGTADVVERFARSTTMRVRYAYEATPGVARARNRGLHEAAGEIIAFTDDDCLVDCGWLQQLVAELDADAHTVMVFGRTRMAVSTQPALSVKDDDERRLYEYPTPPWVIGHGNNMAMRRALVDEVGSFDEGMGAGTRVGSGSDTEYVFRILRRGHRILYSPGAVVWHDLSRYTAEDAQRVWDAYARGRGAFYIMHTIRGDRWAAKMLARELLRKARAIVAGANRRRAWRDLVGLLAGVAYRLRGELRPRGHRPAAH
ncbi:MAG: glycosyltransferase [Armatimonadota bacterium]|nr:glycosyltransferase [Armatimonadota bacterium]